MAFSPLVTGDLTAAAVEFGMEYQGVFDNTASWIDKYASVLPMNNTIMKMPWQQVLPQMSPWLGNRKVSQMVANVITYEAKLTQLTTSISRSDAEDDQLGLWLAVQPQLMARQIKRQPEVELSQEIEFNPTTFDGTPFFGQNHPVDKSNPLSPTTNSNVLLNLSGPNAGLTADNVQALQAQLMLLQGPDGTPVNFFASTLMVHPSLALIARQIANGGFYPTNNSAGTGGTAAVGPVSNQMQGFVEVVSNPYLTDANRWYLICNSAGLSPLLWFERTAPEIEYRVSPSDWNVFDQDTYLIGARRRATAGLGLYYQMGCGTTESSVASIAKPLPIQ